MEGTQGEKVHRRKILTHYKFTKILFGGMILIFLTCLCAAPSLGLDLYGNTDPEEYLSGRFIPEKHPLFIELSSLGLPTSNWKHYLRKEAAQALKNMYTQFKNDHPGVKFWVQSSTRNWRNQKALWEEKWNGKKLVEGKKLNLAYPGKLERALKILEYSSMPGTSRHHWGTDFDINILTNEYFSRGNGAILYNWMRKNAGNYGFCQPYNAGRKDGYKEERWHWSYMPLSRHFLNDWLKYFSAKDYKLPRKAYFDGAEASWGLSVLYVTSINPDCRQEK